MLWKTVRQAAQVRKPRMVVAPSARHAFTCFPFNARTAAGAACPSPLAKPRAGQKQNKGEMMRMQSAVGLLRVGSAREATSVACASTIQGNLAPAEDHGESEKSSYCPGCGIKLQTHDDGAPGFYKEPAALKASALSDAALGSSVEEFAPSAERPLVFCARCFSIRNYGRVKNPDAEDRLPSFDVASKLCSRIGNIKGIRQTLLCVVDITDFDGSVPHQTLARIANDPLIKEKNVSVVLALNKLDLLPRVASDQRIRSWANRQIRSLDLPEDVTVKLVSAAVGKGIPDLAATLQRKVGQYGHLWVFGAQNAGKSSLINALRKYSAEGGDRGAGGSRGREGGPVPQLTEASLPGTTIGFVRLDELLAGSRCKAFDTPGLLHRYQYTSTFSPLTYQEIGMLLPKRRLKPRTYRVPVGYTVSIGGLARVDLISAPGSSAYFTLWCSDEVTTHFGKTENAEARQAASVGDKLVPPLDPEVGMPNLVSSDFLVEGRDWKRSSEDIAIAGLGWVAVGVSGECEVRAWAPKSVLLCQRDALMPDYAKDFERPGFGMMLPVAPKKGRRAKW